MSKYSQDHKINLAFPIIMPIHSRKVPLKSPLSPGQTLRFSAPAPLTCLSAKKLASEAKKRTSWRHDPLGSRKSYLEEAVFKDDEAEEPLFLWEDERTLVADLMHDKHVPNSIYTLYSCLHQCRRGIRGRQDYAAH